MYMMEKMLFWMVVQSRACAGHVIPTVLTLGHLVLNAKLNEMDNKIIPGTYLSNTL
jgi:hypothetical protein